MYVRVHTFIILICYGTVVGRGLVSYYLVMCVYYIYRHRKSFEVEKLCGFCGSIDTHETFTVKHFLLVLKMAGHGPGSTLKEFTFHLGEGLSSNAAFPELLIHGSNMPVKLISQYSCLPMMYS